MKVLLAIALLYALPSYSQLSMDVLEKDTSRHIPDGSNVIYLKNSSLKSICNALLDAGFTIDKKMDDLQVVETKSSKADISTNVWNPVVSVRIKDSIAIIKTKVYFYTSDSFTPGTYSEKHNGKPKQNAYVFAFLQAYKVAKLAGGEITFDKLKDQ